MEDALKPAAPQLTPKGNICWQTVSQKGSIEKGRAQSVFIEKQTYFTQLVEHAYLETESCITYIDDRGFLVVRSGSQAPHSYRDQIAAICKIPTKRVVMQTTTAGGAFGAKGDLSIQHLCALGTLTTGRPVRLQLTREESIRLHVKRHPFKLEYETGIDKQGRLTYCVVRSLADAGAYHSASLAVMENATSFATGPYSINHVDIQSTAVFTNNPVCGAMRGFGVIQVCLAMERQIDELARKLKRDPLEIRLQNCLDVGKESQWGQIMGPGVGIKKCLQELLQATRNAKANIPLKPHEFLGLGFAGSYKNTSSPTNASWGKADLHFALNQHGRFLVYAGGCELGQGFVNVIAQFAALGLGVPIERVEVVFGSTTHTDYPTLTSASQQTFIAGNAALKGGELFANKIIKTAARLYKCEESELSLQAQGVVRRDPSKKGKDGVVASFHELSWRTQLAGKPLSLTYAHEPPLKTIDLPKRVTKTGPEQAILPSLGYGAQAALVKVNQLTGEIKVLKIFTAHDVGRVANFNAARGQVVGGVVMSLGGCLKEKLELKEGRIVNDNFDTYAIPRTLDIPEIEVIFVEEPDPLGPLGVKGLGEIPSLATAPAILNAIRDAVGIKLHTVPINATMIAKPEPKKAQESAG
jgi:CO/xanthine dehydrogenase Mo-binding subunit